jgi:DNA-binding CsgD family transcriptional regulator
VARYAAIPAVLDTGQNVVYAQVHFKQEANFPLEIVSQKSFDQTSFLFLSLSGGYYGFAVIILIISMVMYVYFNEKIYGIYAFFLFCITVSLFYDDGFFSFFFPSLVSYFDGIEMSIHWLSSIAATLFCFTFLDINYQFPNIRKWFWLLLLIAGAFYLDAYFRDNFFSYRTAGYVVYLVFLGTWLLSCYFAIKKPYARILVFAYLLVLFSSMGHYILRVAGHQFITISSNEIKLGGIVEMLILSGGILYRFKFLKNENEQTIAQLKEYLAELKQQSPETNGTAQDGVAAMSKTYELSKRESEVLAELAKGYSNKQIAKALYISVATVKFHTSNIYEKLQVSSRFEAIEKVT